MPLSRFTNDDLADRIDAIVGQLPNSSFSPEDREALRKKLYHLVMSTISLMVEISIKQITYKLDYKCDSPIYGIPRCFVDLMNQHFKDDYTRDEYWDNYRLLKDYQAVCDRLCFQENSNVNIIEMCFKENETQHLLSHFSTLDFFKRYQLIYIQGCKMAREHPEVLPLLQATKLESDVFNDELQPFVDYCHTIQIPSNFDLNHIQTDLEVMRCTEAVLKDIAQQHQYMLKQTWGDDIRQIRNQYAQELFKKLSEMHQEPEFYQGLIAILKTYDLYDQPAQNALRDMLLRCLHQESQKDSPPYALVTNLESILEIMLSEKMDFSDVHQVQDRLFTSLARLKENLTLVPSLGRIFHKMTALGLIGAEEVAFLMLEPIFQDPSEGNKKCFKERLKEVYSLPYAQKLIAALLGALIDNQELSFQDKHELVLFFVELEADQFREKNQTIGQDALRKYFEVLCCFIKDSSEEKFCIFSDTRLFQHLCEFSPDLKSYAPMMAQAFFQSGKPLSLLIAWLDSCKDTSLLLEFYCLVHSEWNTLHKSNVEKSDRHFEIDEKFIHGLLDFASKQMPLPFNYQYEILSSLLHNFVECLLIQAEEGQEPLPYLPYLQKWMLLTDSFGCERFTLELLSSLAHLQCALEPKIHLFGELCAFVEKQSKCYQATKVQTGFLISAFEVYTSQFKVKKAETAEKQEKMTSEKGNQDVKVVFSLFDLYSKFDRPSKNLWILHRLLCCYEQLTRFWLHERLIPLQHLL